jgi:hypothetical protein
MKFEIYVERINCKLSFCVLNILYLFALTKIKKATVSQYKMDGMKVEPDSEEESRPYDRDIQRNEMNQEETEPMNCVEVKCELEVGQVVV